MLVLKRKYWLTPQTSTDQHRPAPPTSNDLVTFLLAPPAKHHLTGNWASNMCSLGGHTSQCRPTTAEPDTWPDISTIIEALLPGGAKGSWPWGMDTAASTPETGKRTCGCAETLCPSSLSWSGRSFKSRRGEAWGGLRCIALGNWHQEHMPSCDIDRNHTEKAAVQPPFPSVPSSPLS